MDEPGDSQKGKALVNRVCGKCHTVKKGTKENLSRWGMYTNPILWAQMMWNHSPQMEQEMKKKGVSQVEFKGSEMVDLIAYIRSVSLNIEKVYLSPGDPRRGEKLFTAKGCVQCHAAGGQYDLSRRKEFPKTLAHLTGVMWNHSGEMRKEMVIKNIPFPHLSSEEMADLVAYLFSIRYFDEPGNATNGKSVFIKKQCHLCHTKATKTADLSKLKGQISPLLMAQAMWNHGPRMLEQMRKAKIPWQKIDGMEMVDLMEYLNQGMP
jgi:mono/diheme cytochrome c family protein